MNKIMTVEERVRVGIDYPDGKLIIPADIESIVRADRTTLKDTLLEELEGKKANTRPMENGIPVETYGYEEEFNSALDEAKAIVSKVLVNEK